jgi:hypothetical protein
VEVVMVVVVMVVVVMVVVVVVVVLVSVMMCQSVLLWCSLAYYGLWYQVPEQLTRDILRLEDYVDR